MGESLSILEMFQIPSSFLGQMALIHQDDLNGEGGGKGMEEMGLNLGRFSFASHLETFGSRSVLNRFNHFKYCLFNIANYSYYSLSLGIGSGEDI